MSIPVKCYKSVTEYVLIPPPMKVEKGDCCIEHWVLESVCSRFSKELAAEAKKK